MKQKVLRGYSILELLVAVGVFAVVGIVAVNSLASSFTSSKKSDALSDVKSDVDYALSTMERLLRNAQSIEPPPISSATRVVYVDEYGNTGMYFDCDAGGGYIASGSAILGTVRLTSTGTIIDCSGAPAVFSYPALLPGVPSIVEINIKGTDKNFGTSVEGASVTANTRILLRNYSE